jgi:hypothetical protein
MPDRTMDEILDALGETVDHFDQISRVAHTKYRSYAVGDIAIEHDVRAQAACTYAHMLAEADRRFMNLPRVVPLDIRGLKLWLFKDFDVVFRLKKMDEDGRSRNYPTKQAKGFDAGKELPELPMPPIRLTAGYLLDKTGSEIIRTQIARPERKGVAWCAAIIPEEDRKDSQRRWADVTRQPRFGW